MRFQPSLKGFFMRNFPIAFYFMKRRTTQQPDHCGIFFLALISTKGAGPSSYSFVPLTVGAGLIR